MSNMDYKTVKPVGELKEDNSSNSTKPKGDESDYASKDVPAEPQGDETIGSS